MLVVPCPPLLPAPRRVWRADTGAPVRVDVDSADARLAFTSTMCGVAWHPTLDLVAACSSETGAPVLLFAADDQDPE
jgi:hypothetical protein